MSWAVVTYAPASASPAAWIADRRPSFPVLRMIQLATGPTDAVSGVMTIKWYGPMSMQNLTIADGRLDFFVSNGNPRLGRERTRWRWS